MSRLRQMTLPVAGGATRASFAPCGPRGLYAIEKRAPACSLESVRIFEKKLVEQYGPGFYNCY